MSNLQQIYTQTIGVYMKPKKQQNQPIGFQIKPKQNNKSQLCFYIGPKTQTMKTYWFLCKTNKI